jgi:hypothetical protein
MARNSAKNSAKFALEFRIRQMAFSESGPAASVNLVVDRTDAKIRSEKSTSSPSLSTAA